MEFQWGDNPEYTFYLYYQSGFAALPLSISWHSYDGGNGKMYSASLHFFCFGIAFEIWKNKEPNKLTQETIEKTDRGEDVHTVDSVDELIKELEDGKD